jgi:hypothetical protein
MDRIRIRQSERIYNKLADTNLDGLFLTFASSKRCDLRRAMLALLRGSWES